jgi:hypothetical protein
LLLAGDRLDPEARLPWALTTAGNLLVNLRRDADRASRHRHRLVDRAEPAHPDSDLIALEEAAAVRSALSGLDVDDRKLIMQHVDGASTIDLAGATESSPGAVAARLHRTRARMRLDYLLALRRVQLPSPNCRRVLLAVSAADQRRQHALGSADHLANCPTCADLVVPLAERKSRLAGIAVLPLIIAGRWALRASRVARAHALPVSAVTASAAVAVGVYAASRSDKPAATRPPPIQQTSLAAVRTASNVPLIPVPAAARLRHLVGQHVIAEDIAVQSVVSHPGFWIGTSGSERLYVHLTRAELVRDRIRTGSRVAFTGKLVANLPGFAADDGVTGNEDAGLLTEQGVHVNVDATAIRQR